MLRRTGARLVHYCGQSRGAALRYHDAVSANTFCGTDYRAEIVRIAYLVAHDDERRLAALCRERQNILDRAVVAHGAHGDDALMRLGLAHKVELTPVALHDDYALLARLGRDVSQRLVHVAAGDEYFVYRAACAQRLDNGVAAFNKLIFYLVVIYHQKNLR